MKTRILIGAIAAVPFVWSSGWAYDAGPVADGGTVAGMVKLQGTASPPKPIEITKDKEVCGVTPKTETLLVSASGGVKNAVVSITNISKGKAFDAAAKPAIDQKDCRYAPHVTLVPVGTSLEVINSDGTLHNIHTFSKKNPSVNMAQPKFKKTMTLASKLDQPEVFEARCDAHGWMSGWVVVEDTPYYAVTDDNGAYKLSDVPPGSYEVKVWHEKLGEKSQKVTVPAKGEAKADFELAAK